MIAYLIKSAVAMAVLLGVYYLFLEKEKMHRFNRFYLLGSLVFSLALPLLTIPIYVADEHVVIEPTAFAPVMPVTIAPPVEATNYWLYIAIGIYTLITLLLGIRFAVNIIRFYRLKSRNTVVHYNGATLVLLDADVLPHTFMGNIFLSKKEYEHRLIEPELLTHELAHVRQRHTLDVLFTEALKTIFWFNPLPYLYKRAIQVNHEFLADESTLVNHNNVPTYQKLLLDKAVPYTAYALASSINFSITKKRFIMMTKTTTARKKTFLQLMMLPVLGLTCFSLCYEVVAQEPQIAVAARASKTYMTDRDEYYSNVVIIVNDKANNVIINKKYEQLTSQEKDKYIYDMPVRTAGKKYHYPGKAYVLNISKEIKDDKIVATAGYDRGSGAATEGFKWPPSDKIKKLDLHKLSDAENDALRKTQPDLYPTPDTKLAQVFITYENQKGETVSASTFISGDETVQADGTLTNGSEKIIGVKNPKIVDSQDEIAMVRQRTAGTTEKITDQKTPSNLIGVADQDKVYSAADTSPQPEFPGGIDNFYKTINKEFKMPTVKEDLTARIYIQFIIEKDGSMSNIKLLRDPGYGLGDEAVRTLKTLKEKWKPGMVKGKAVRTSFALPITINIKS